MCKKILPNDRIFFCILFFRSAFFTATKINFCNVKNYIVKTDVKTMSMLCFCCLLKKSKQIKPFTRNDAQRDVYCELSNVLKMSKLTTLKTNPEIFFSCVLGRFNTRTGWNR
jgi:hypothetical protein